MSLQFFRF